MNHKNTELFLTSQFVNKHDKKITLTITYTMYNVMYLKIEIETIISLKLCVKSF